MKKAAVAVALTVVGVLFAFLFLKGKATVTDYAMNTVITVTASGKGTKKAVEQKVNKAVEEIRRIDRLMSVSSPQSDIRKINSAKKGEYTPVSPEVFSLIEMCVKVSTASGGAFDITVNPLSELWDFTAAEPKVPQNYEIRRTLTAVDYRDIRLNSKEKSVALARDGMSISLGAVAKGYAADRAAQILKAEGINDAVIDLGGNIYALGRKKIGIQTPFEKRGEYFDIYEAQDTSVVTSGSYERYFESGGKIYHHILDPKTGYPAESDLKSVTVAGDNSAMADALSTAVFVLGRDKAEEFLSVFPGFDVKLLTAEDEIVNIGFE